MPIDKEDPTEHLGAAIERVERKLEEIEERLNEDRRIVMEHLEALSLMVDRRLPPTP